MFICYWFFLLQWIWIHQMQKQKEIIPNANFRDRECMVLIFRMKCRQMKQKGLGIVLTVYFHPPISSLNLSKKMNSLRSLYEAHFNHSLSCREKIYQFPCFCDTHLFNSRVWWLWLVKCGVKNVLLISMFWDLFAIHSSINCIAFISRIKWK